MENDGMVKQLREVPETDAAPVVHSRVINMGGYPACEHCGSLLEGYRANLAGPNNQYKEEKDG